MKPTHRCLICNETFMNEDESNLHLKKTFHPLMQGLEPCPLYPHGYDGDR